MDRGAWQATVQGFKESDTTKVIYATISIKCITALYYFVPGMCVYVHVCVLGHDVL